MSESQLPSDRSFIDLGLMLTNQIVNTKTKLKEINPSVIYEWEGQTLYNQISGKGIFRVRNSQTNELLFQCEVKKWKNGVPTGKIKLRKITSFSNMEQLSDDKIKEIQIYQGQSQNLKKNGKGTFSYQQFFLSGKSTKTTILGQWENDILINGILQNEQGTKQLDLTNNIEFVKSSRKILEENNLKDKKKKKVQTGKENLLKQRSSNAKIEYLECQKEKNVKNNYLSPLKLK